MKHKMFYTGLVNAMHHNPTLTPEKLVETYSGIPALRVHNPDWRPEFGGIIPGIVNIADAGQDEEKRIGFLRQKFCTHQIKILTQDDNGETMVFQGKFPTRSLKEIAEKWQKTALKVLVGNGGVGHAPYVDAAIYQTSDEIRFYAICPEDGDLDLWRQSCRQIALVLEAQEAIFKMYNLQKNG